MDRLKLLSGESGQDDQVLETDVMRFLAIIGIVFWIVFALVKSIPFQIPDVDFVEPPPVVEAKPVTAEVPTPVVPEQISKEFQPAEARHDAAVPEKAAPPKVPVKTVPKWKGVRIQFSSFDDLMALLTAEKVRIFGRAQARGFDLYFSGRPEGDRITFDAARNLPAQLWEIKSGKDYAYFLTLMSQAYPAIRTFPTKQVLVSFTDRDLETRFEETLNRLKQEGKNGMLSITRDGELDFQDFDQPDAIINDEVQNHDTEES